MYSNVAGKLEEDIRLPYKPIAKKAVCCSTDYIFVTSRDPIAVQVHHSRTGLHIQTLSHQQLGVRQNSYIHANQCNHDGTVLQLAIGDGLAVRSLHTYKVRCTFIISRTTHSFIVRLLLVRVNETSLLPPIMC